MRGGGVTQRVSGKESFHVESNGCFNDIDGRGGNGSKRDVDLDPRDLSTGDFSRLAALAE